MLEITLGKGADYPSADGRRHFCVYTDLSWWHLGRKFDVPVYTIRDIYVKALRLLNSSEYPKLVRNLAVNVYDECSRWYSKPMIGIYHYYQ
jgi:hypothetical protein